MHPDDLTGPGLAVVEALIAAPLAWQSAAQLAWSVGWYDHDTCYDALADLESSSWLESWEDCPGCGVGITFTARAAAALAIRIVEVGPDETPRWARADRPDPFPPKAKGVFRDYGSLGLVIDPAPSAEDLAIAAEEVPVEKPRRRRRRELPCGAWNEARRAELARERRRRRLRERLTKA